MVTIASFFQPVSAFAPLSATLPAQIIPHTIKSQPLPACIGEMDYKAIEAQIYCVNNYFALTGLSDPSQ